MSAAEPGPINPSVDPAAGPISAALARAPDLTPQPEPETPAPRLPDQKPGGEVRLYDDDAGIVRDAVVLGESQQGIRIRFDGNEYDLDPQTFDRARSTARQKDEEAKGAKTDAAPPAAAADASAISPQSAPRKPEDTLKLQDLRRRLRMVEARVEASGMETPREEALRETLTAQISALEARPADAAPRTTEDLMGGGDASWRKRGR